MVFAIFLSTVFVDLDLSDSGPLYFKIRAAFRADSKTRAFQTRKPVLLSFPQSPRLLRRGRAGGG